jgi:hypothetical protein
LEKKYIEYSDRTSELEKKLLKANTVLKDKEDSKKIKPLIRPSTPVPTTPKGKKEFCPFCHETKSDVQRHINTMHTPQ